MKKPWLLKKIVLPQDTDHAGVMWHGSYINWLEEARIKALSNVGLSYACLSAKGYEMPVVDLKIRYINSLFHGELVTLKSYLAEQKGIKLRWKTFIFNNNDSLSAEALVTLVLLKRVKSKITVVRRMPDNISTALRLLESGPDK